MSVFGRIKDKLFWRDKFCPSCGCYTSCSNMSPCLYCHRGDLAMSNFESESEWWDTYSSRVSEALLHSNRRHTNYSE